MRYFFVLLFLCVSFNSPASVRYANRTDFFNSETAINSSYEKKSKIKPAFEKNTERYLILAAIYLSAAVAVIFISLIFQPIFLFAIIFLPVFLWSMSSICAFLAQLLMLKGLSKRTRDENQMLAAALLSFMFSRILLLCLLFFLADPIIALLFLALFVPGFLLQITVISKLLSAKKL